MVRATALMALLAAASPEPQFDLVCSGTLGSQSLALGDSREPFSYHMRFDLEANRWCDGECKATREILEVSPVQITLVREKSDTPRERIERSTFINRETGKYFGLSMSDSRLTGILIMKWDGSCEKQPFTGFPTVQTKF